MVTTLVLAEQRNSSLSDFSQTSLQRIEFYLNADFLFFGPCKKQNNMVANPNNIMLCMRTKANLVSPLYWEASQLKKGFWDQPILF